MIERKKTPNREDTLAARLKSLRNQDDTPPSASKTAPKSSSITRPSAQNYELQDQQDEDMFQTDDQTLEELLGDVRPDEDFQAEPDDAKVKALLEELADSIPKDDKVEEGKDDDSDDSDGEHMTRDVEQAMARFRDEAELEESLGNKPNTDDLTLPKVPFNLSDLPSAPATDIDDITARLAALRPPSDPLALPEVPTSKPAGKPINRLASRTNYTDDDVDSWCTVCLEDATLRCLGCDDDVYCTRCWREMHIGPSAGFDESGHKAVQFTKNKKEEKRKVAVGA